MVIVFLDASALIYLIEGKEPFHAQVRAQFDHLIRTDKPVELAVSRLSYLECNVKPLREAHSLALRQYQAFFSRVDLIWVELNRQVIELATVIRAKHGLPTPDCIQAASCLQLGVNHLFMTGDHDFLKIKDLNVKIIG